MPPEQSSVVEVLILEDDRDCRLLAEMCVKRAIPHAKITAIASVAEAKTLGEQNGPKFAVSILDGMLLDGTLKEAWPFLAKRCRDGKLLIVSALQAQDLLAISSGIENATIMQKPFVPSALQAVLASGDTDA